MADIELVIKIPEDVFKRTVFYREFRDLNDCVTTIKALEKAVPLPKGHGDIVDIEHLIDMFWDGNSMEITKYDLSVIEPIIEKEK